MKHLPCLWAVFQTAASLARLWDRSLFLVKLIHLRTCSDLFGGVGYSYSGLGCSSLVFLRAWLRGL